MGTLVPVPVAPRMKPRVGSPIWFSGGATNDLAKLPRSLTDSLMRQLAAILGFEVDPKSL